MQESGTPGWAKFIVFALFLGWVATAICLTMLVVKLYIVPMNPDPETAWGFFLYTFLILGAIALAIVPPVAIAVWSGEAKRQEIMRLQEEQLRYKIEDQEESRRALFLVKAGDFYDQKKLEGR